MPLWLVVEKRRGPDKSFVKLSIQRKNEKQLQHIHIQRIKTIDIAFVYNDKLEYIIDTSNSLTITDVSSDLYADQFIPIAVKELSFGKIKKGSIADSLGLQKMDHILKIHSLDPQTMVDHYQMYRSLMFGKSELTRMEREKIAVVVSVANKCHY